MSEIFNNISDNEFELLKLEYDYEEEILNNYEDEEQNIKDFEENESIEVLLDYYLENKEFIYTEYIISENINIKITAIYSNFEFKKQVLLTYKNIIYIRTIILKNEEEIKKCKDELNRQSKNL